MHCTVRCQPHHSVRGTVRIASGLLPSGNGRRDCPARASATNCRVQPVEMEWLTCHQIVMADSTAVDRLELRLVALAVAIDPDSIGAFVAGSASLCTRCCWMPTIRQHASAHFGVHYVQPDRQLCAEDLVRSRRLHRRRLWQNVPAILDPVQTNSNKSRAPVTMCVAARATYSSADGTDAFGAADAATQMWMTDANRHCCRCFHHRCHRRHYFRPLMHCAR